jgi:hypothetical protein
MSQPLAEPVAPGNVSGALVIDVLWRAVATTAVTFCVESVNLVFLAYSLQINTFLIKHIFISYFDDKLMISLYWKGMNPCCDLLSTMYDVTEEENK